ncbi:uncharacterized protein LOC116657620 isoform X3 [Camelus ferus]|uniref:Uncharacterized protein LOC116657620 isoform X3 n=1 Tax=Camelus ferus TaxID=419612 RepID=A0A8B8RG18_CAMFR|nr:uncharacterized protein LOC116657620 isoform X3 [Camelus ferus]
MAVGEEEGAGPGPGGSLRAAVWGRGRAAPEGPWGLPRRPRLSSVCRGTATVTYFLEEGRPPRCAGVFTLRLSQLPWVGSRWRQSRASSDPLDSAGSSSDIPLSSSTEVEETCPGPGSSHCRSSSGCGPPLSARVRRGGCCARGCSRRLPAQPGETVAAAAPETPEITVAPKAQPREGATGTNRDLSARRPGHPSLRTCTRPPSPPFAPGARSVAAAALSCDPTPVSSFLLSSRVPVE